MFKFCKTKLWGELLLRKTKSAFERIPSFKVLGLCIAAQSVIVSDARALDGTIAETRDFGSCTISSISFASVENGGVVVSTGVSTFTAGGAVWLFGSPNPFNGPVDASVLSGCVAGSSPSEFTNIVTDGVDAISFAAETSASLSFDFRGRSFSYSLTGAVGTTVSASPSITDFTVPTVTSVTVPADGSYGTGQNLDFIVNFDNPATVTGDVGLAIAIGSPAVAATYVSGSGTNSLLFRHTVQPGDAGMVAVGFLFSLGGSITGGGGLDANLTLNGVGPTTGVLVDTTPPTVTIGTVIPTAPGVFTASITLSEPASGNLFEATDITVDNATASLTGSGTNFTATIRPINPGFFLFGVLAGAFTDAAGNENTSSAGVSALFDNVPPTITLGPLTDTGSGTFTSAITLSEPTGLSNLFEQVDLTVGNGTATLTGSGTSFVATITPSGVGVVTLDVAAGAFTDPGLNDNIAATQVSVLFDNVAPTITLGALTDTGAGTFTSAITLSEPASGNLFEQGDLTIGNGSATLTGSGTSFIATITPTSGGLVTLDVAAAAFTDAGGNNSTAAIQVSSLFDNIPPTITLGALTETSVGVYTSAIALSEPASGNLFELSDLSVGNGTATLTGSGTSFVATITATTGGAVTLDVAAAAFTDAGGNDSIAATQVSTLFDVIAPTVVITSSSSVHDGSSGFITTVTFNEPVTGFVDGELTATNATVGALSPAGGAGTVFTATITPAGPLDVVLSVAANVALDVADNMNTAATDVTVSGTLVEQTQAVISSFLLNRANHILSNQPDLIGFVTGANTRGGGSLGNLALDANTGSQVLAFATSRSKILAEMRKADAKALSRSRQQHNTIDPLAVLSRPSNSFLIENREQEISKINTDPKNTNSYALGGDDVSVLTGADLIASQRRSVDAPIDEEGRELEPQQQSRAGAWDVWTEIYGSNTNSDTSDSRLWVGYLGAHVFVNDYTIVGVLGQLDWSDETNAAFNSKADGVGWLIGPYIAGQLPGQKLFYEARASWGTSDNDVSPLGTYIDSFDTTRLLLSGKLSGSLAYGDYTIAPSVSVSYFEETQESYLDSLNNVIPEQTISLGEVRFGPEISRTVELEDGTILTPSVGISGIFNFGIEDNNASQGFALGNDDFRARLDVGFSATNPDTGLTLSAEVFYDGIGIDDFDSYGGRVRLTVPLN